jgi:hypothetical protein
MVHRCVTAKCLDFIHSLSLMSGDIRWCAVVPIFFRSEKIESILNSELTSVYQSLRPPRMSNKSCQTAVILAKATLRQSRPFRITPPPVYLQERTYFTRRSTSFYTNSYPQPGSSGVEIPFTPPAPASDRLETSYRPEDGVQEDGKRKERKAKYLESLMDKAGELSLRCMLP